MPATRPIADDADPLSTVLEEHALHLELCDVLEGIADALPGDADPRLVRAALGYLRHAFPARLRDEDRLLQQLRKQCAVSPLLDAAVEQARAEHAADTGAALEITSELEVLARNGRVANADMLGYMLRGFFEAQRRHIRWESSVILPLMREAMGVGARSGRPVRERRASASSVSQEARIRP